MPEITLQPGSTYQLKAGDPFVVHLQFNPSAKWRLDETPHAETTVIGDNFRVRDVRGDTTLTLLPMGGDSFALNTVAYASVEVAAQGLILQLPQLAIGDQRHGELLRVTREGDTLTLTVPKPTGREKVEGASAAVQNAIVSMETKGLGTVGVVIDHSASFQRFLTDRQRQALALFTSGVLSAAEGEATLIPTAAGVPSKTYSHPGDLRDALQASAASAEVDWSRGLHTLAKVDGIQNLSAVIVISDDLPGILATLNTPMHLLLTREPAGVLPPNVRYTVFTDSLVDAVLREDAAVLRRVAQDVRVTLSGEAAR